MATTQSKTGYVPIAKTLHWGMPAIWIIVWCIGTLAIYWRDALNPDHALTIAHKALASRLLVLIVARIGWRLTHRPPPLAANMSAMMQRAAHAGHIALYGFALLALPLSASPQGLCARQRFGVHNANIGVNRRRGDTGIAFRDFR